MFSGVFFCRSWPSSLWTVSDAVSSKVDKVLLIEPAANSFVYKEINALYKNWIIYFGGTDRPGELCCNFSFFNDFTQIRNFSIQFPDLDSESLALLNLWPCLKTLVFILQWLSLFREILIIFSQFPLFFLQTQNEDAPFRSTAFVYSLLRDFTLEDISKLGTYAAASEFCEWVQYGIDVYICSSLWHQVKPRSSLWFSGPFVAAIAHGNQSQSACTNRINALSPRVISSSLVDFAKWFLKLPNLLMLIKHKYFNSPRTWL